MNFSLVNIVTGLFVLNALFWSFGSHTQHCDLAKNVGMKCLEHNTHLMMGVVFFLSSMTLIHRGHLSKYAPFLKRLN